MKNWQKINKFVEIKSPWLNIIGEKWQDDQENLLDYWRIEKADSVIIITLWQDQFIFPKLTYRVGIDQVTLDFAGGRIKENQAPENAVNDILKKELNLNHKDVKCLQQINQEGWAINSSFSNQKLYGFLAEIDPNISLNYNFVGVTYPHTKEGIKKLLKNLTCVQCRIILLEWLRLKD